MVGEEEKEKKYIPRHTQDIRVISGHIMSLEYSLLFGVIFYCQFFVNGRQDL